METRAVKRRRQATVPSSFRAQAVTSAAPRTPNTPASPVVATGSPATPKTPVSATRTTGSSLFNTNQLMFPASPSLVANATLSPQSKLASLTPFLGEVFSTKHFSDLTIRVEDREFPAHRLVLCGASAPFRAMLMGSMREARQDVITLEDVRADMFELWLAFVYGREVILSNDNVLGLLELAVMFDIGDLRDQCCQALETTLSEETAWLILEVADRWQLTDLRARSFNFVINSFDKLTAPVQQVSAVGKALLQPLAANSGFGNDFLAASSSVIIDVLGSDFLNATNEMQVFEQATRWLTHHYAIMGKAVSLGLDESILSLVRFALIPPAVIESQVLTHPLMQSASLQSLVREAIRLSPCAHPLPKTASAASPQSKPARTTKRDRRRRDEKPPVLNPRTPFVCKYETKASMRGHSDSVCALKVFRNLLFSGGSDNTVAVWDLVRGTGLTMLREHSDMVLGLDVWVQQRTATVATGCRTRSGTAAARRHITARVPPNHNHSAPAEVCRLISCSDDETIRVWNMADWTVEKVLTGHRGGVNAVLVVNGNRLYSGAKDRLIKVWELGGSWECLASMEGHQDGVLALAQVGHKLVSAADDWTIRVWDTNTFTCERVLEGHNDAVLSLLVVGSKLLSASVEIKVWDTADWTCEQTVRGHEGGVFGLASAGNQIFSASEDGSVKVWDSNTLTCLRTLTHHRDAVFAVAVHNNRLITASADLDIVLWS